MDLVKRYVQSVRSLLPKDQQDDIAAELEDAIRGRIEDRERDLGRKLNDMEVESILHEFGHPIEAAGRYAPQRHLIGPDYYPYWWLGAKIAVVIAAGFTFMHAVATIVSDHGGAAVVAQIWTDFFSIGFGLIGVFTVVCAVFEHLKIKLFANWRAHDLKPFNLGAAWPAMSDTSWISSLTKSNPDHWGDNWGRGRVTTRAGAAAALFFSLLGVSLWALLPLYIDLLPSWMDPRWWLNLWGFPLSEQWQLIFWALMLAQGVAQAMVHAGQFAAPTAFRVHALPNFFAHAFAAVIAVLALNETGLLSLGIPTSAEFHDMGAIDTVERVVELVLVIITVASVWGMLYSLWRIFGPPSTRPVR